MRGRYLPDDRGFPAGSDSKDICCISGRIYCQEKYRQIRKEAGACVIALVVLIVFWAIAGFGVSRLDITVYHTPLWAITGCIGTWVFSIIMVVWIVKKVFKDFDLEDEDENNER